MDFYPADGSWRQRRPPRRACGGWTPCRFEASAPRGERPGSTGRRTAPARAPGADRTKSLPFAAGLVARIPSCSRGADAKKKRDSLRIHRNLERKFRKMNDAEAFLGAEKDYLTRKPDFYTSRTCTILYAQTAVHVFYKSYQIIQYFHSFRLK